MATRKKLYNYIDENIKNTIDYEDGTCASLKGYYTLSAYIFMSEACRYGADRKKTVCEALELITYYKSLQEVYHELACGLPDFADFDFINSSHEAHDLVKKLLDQTEGKASKYDNDQAIKYLTNQFYMRTSKHVNWFEVCAWCIADGWMPSEDRINFIKKIK